MKPDQWSRVLAKYREPIHSRSIFELTVTLVPFVGIWALAWLSLSISPWLAVALALLNSGFLVRVFMIQHDLGHGSFIKNRRLGDWIGRALGVLTLTPYDVWRKSHAVHHASSGNLDRRGVGDVPTMTVQEYRQCGWYGRLGYRVVRNPIFLFGLAPTYVFFLTNRLPLGQMRCGWRPWLSSQGTNIAIGTVLAGLFWFGGIDVVVYVFLPTTLFAASVGMWLFYVQHQFEDTSWEREHDWNVQSAAFEASSYYDLPRPLAWITADIGAHHVHHLASRIPSYRLREALNENKALTTCQRITLRDSLRCARLHLWDETSGQLVSFADANSITT